MSDEKLNVHELMETASPRLGVDPEDHEPTAARYAIEDQDVSDYKGVSEEYKTYASHVDAPASEDAKAGKSRAKNAKASKSKASKSKGEKNDQKMKPPFQS